MPAIKIIDPFTNIELKPITSENPDGEAVFLSNLRALNIGDGGDNVFRADASGIWLGGKTYASATFKVSMAGEITATSFTLIGGTIRYGKTSISDSAHTGYYIGAEGFYFGKASDATKLKFLISDGSVDYIGTISGRASSVLASAINADGHFIDARLDTSAKQILDAFTFGASGAIQIGTYEAGVSGDVKISPNGIVARNKSNQTTVSIDGSTGDANFRGTITASTITGSTLQTGTSGANVDITSSRLRVRSNTTEVLYLELGDYGGVFGINTTGGNNVFKIEIDGSGTAKAIQFIGADTYSDYMSFQVNSDSFYFSSPDSAGAGGLYPLSSNKSNLGSSSNYWYAVHYGSGGLVSHTNPLFARPVAKEIIKSFRNTSKGALDKANVHSAIRVVENKKNLGVDMDGVIRALIGLTSELDERLDKLENDKNSK